MTYWNKIATVALTAIAAILAATPASASSSSQAGALCDDGGRGNECVVWSGIYDGSFSLTSGSAGRTFFDHSEAYCGAASKVDKKCPFDFGQVNKHMLGDWITQLYVPRYHGDVLVGYYCMGIPEIESGSGADKILGVQDCYINKKTTRLKGEAEPATTDPSDHWTDFVEHQSWIISVGSSNHYKQVMVVCESLKYDTLILINAGNKVTGSKECHLALKQ